MKSHAYEAHLHWTGAAHGPAADYQTYSREFSADIPGKPQLTGSSDPAFRGDPAVHNPEDLLLIALSACHMLTYLALCVRDGIQVISYEDRATGTMAQQDGKMRFIEAVLHPECVVSGDLQTATRLHEQAHAGCFIANSVNFPVRNEPKVSAATSPAEAHYSA
ncbi:MAG: OsmC family protein [Candidatus Eremiobacteraeota bacterium]|nr:OsmC family protein [Candidatus Eremiobacteraeota bacterium]